MGLRILELRRSPEGSGSPPLPKVEVWDLQTRLFHWGTVACFITAFLSAGRSSALHEAAGYALGGLVAFRLWWGIAGTRHARFSDFVPSPRSLVRYVSALRRGKGERHLGHNPAGAVMILALLALLAAQCATGYLMLTHRFFGVAWLETVHATLAYAVMALVPLHVAGAIYASVKHRENLIWSMVTGLKRAMEGAARETEVEFRRRIVERLRAAEAFSLAAAIVLVALLLARPGPTDSRAAPTPWPLDVVGVEQKNPDEASNPKVAAIAVCRAAAVAGSDGRIDKIVKLLHPDVVRELQLLLRRLGTYRGVPDGIPGAQTRAALATLAASGVSAESCASAS